MAPRTPWFISTANMIPPVCRCRSPANLRYRKLPPRNRLAGGQTSSIPFPSSLFPLFFRRSLRFDSTWNLFLSVLYSLVLTQEKRTLSENCVSIFSIFFPERTDTEQTRIKSRARNLFRLFFQIFNFRRNGKYTRDRLRRLPSRFWKKFSKLEKYIKYELLRSDRSEFLNILRFFLH